MRLTSFGLKGLLAYQQSEVTVHAADLPPGLIAIRGPNGHGKTTLLEVPLAAAFRAFPSRPDRPGRTLMDYAATSDAYLACAFDLEGRGQFRIRVAIDGPRRKTSAVLVFVNADGREQALNDGKVSSFDQAIAALLPPPELLLASVFGAQTQRGSFVSLGMAERKQLFAQLLGLRHLEEMAARAKQAERLVADALVPLRAQRPLLARDAAPEVGAALEAEWRDLEALEASLLADRASAADDMARFQRELDGLHATATAHAATTAKAEALDVALRGIRSDLATTERQLATARTDATAERARLEAIAAGALEAMDTQLADTTSLGRELQRIVIAKMEAQVEPATKLANNRKLLEASAAVTAAAHAVTVAEAALLLLRAEERQAQEALATAERRERVLADRLQALDRLDRDLAAAREAAALMTRVPFGEQCSPCQFLVNAVTAQARIPELEHACATRPTAETEHAAAQRAIDEARTQLTAVRAQIATHEQTLTTKGPLAKNAAHLAGAAERIAAYEARLQELDDDADRQRAEAHTREAQRVDELRARRLERQKQLEVDLTALDGRTQRQVDALGARVQQLQQDLAAGETTRAAFEADLAVGRGAAEQAAATQQALEARRQDWERLNIARASLSARRDELARQRARYAARQAELEALDARLAVLQQHQVEWGILARACARDGLQTLEIDDAGPTVSAYTNDILRACYGARFSVEIVTQEAKASRGKEGSTTKETFELKVYDAERGGAPRDIADLSGGEKVIVDEALKSAIALLVNARNVHPMRTCWRDETTGPLDDANRERYLAMLRRVHELGGFVQTYFVTHDDEAADQADAQLHVENGRVEIQLPPYRRAAA